MTKASGRQRESVDRERQSGRASPISSPPPAPPPSPAFLHLHLHGRTTGLDAPVDAASSCRPKGRSPPSTIPMPQSMPYPPPPPPASASPSAAAAVYVDVPIDAAGLFLRGELPRPTGSSGPRPRRLVAPDVPAHRRRHLERFRLLRGPQQVPLYLNGRPGRRGRWPLLDGAARVALGWRSRPFPHLRGATHSVSPRSHPAAATPTPTAEGEGNSRKG